VKRAGPLLPEPETFFEIESSFFRHVVAEVLAPQLEPEVARERAREVTQAGRILGRAFAIVSSITAQESSESCVQERRFMLSEPITAHTSSIKQTFACT
jgi:hypothetical protein